MPGLLEGFLHTTHLRDSGRLGPKYEEKMPLAFVIFMTGLSRRLAPWNLWELLFVSLVLGQNRV